MGTEELKSRWVRAMGLVPVESGDEMHKAMAYYEGVFNAGEFARLGIVPEIVEQRGNVLKVMVTYTDGRVVEQIWENGRLIKATFP